MLALLNRESPYESVEIPVIDFGVRYFSLPGKRVLAIKDDGGVYLGRRPKDDSQIPRTPMLDVLEETLFLRNHRVVLRI